MPDGSEIKEETTETTTETPGNQGPLQRQRGKRPTIGGLPVASLPAPVRSLLGWVDAMQPMLYAVAVFAGIAGTLLTGLGDVCKKAADSVTSLKVSGAISNGE